MGRTVKEIKRQTEEWLDERYLIMHMETPPRIGDQCYYEGAIRAVEFLGYSWKRDEKGKHILFKE